MLGSRGTCSPSGAALENKLQCVHFCHDLADSGLEATLDEAPDSSDGPSISLMFPPVYEGDESGGVQTALRSGTTTRWPRL